MKNVPFILALPILALGGLFLTSCSSDSVEDYREDRREYWEDRNEEWEEREEERREYFEDREEEWRERQEDRWGGSPPPPGWGPY